MGVIGSALATVTPKAEPIVPMVMMPSSGAPRSAGFQEAAGLTRRLFSCSAETSAL
jgi:hypothetical protein